MKRKKKVIISLSLFFGVLVVGVMSIVYFNNHDAKADYSIKNSKVYYLAVKKADELNQNNITFIALDSNRIYTVTGQKTINLPKGFKEYFRLTFEYPKDREIGRTSNKFNIGTMVYKGNKNDIVYAQFEGKFLELQRIEEFKVREKISLFNWLN